MAPAITRPSRYVAIWISRGHHRSATRNTVTSPVRSAEGSCPFSRRQLRGVLQVAIGVHRRRRSSRRSSRGSPAASRRSRRSASRWSDRGCSSHRALRGPPSRSRASRRPAAPHPRHHTHHADDRRRSAAAAYTSLSQCAPASKRREPAARAPASTPPAEPHGASGRASPARRTRPPCGWRASPRL
jgi:hypothetical protein